MDTGVSSDLSESRPSLTGEFEELDEDLISQGSAEESGGEFHSDCESNRSESALVGTGRRHRRTRRRGGRKRQLTDEDEDQDQPVCHSIASKQQRITADGGARIVDLTASQHVAHLLKCPECGDATTNLIHHIQMAHPATLARPETSSSAKDHSDILHLNAGPTAIQATPSGRHNNSNSIFLNDEILTNPPEEYKNEEDDPFSAVLREMKIKGEFPCRLCQAVFPNLRALKGK